MNFNVTDSIIYVGVNDHDLDLFEGQYIVPNGMAYNSYVILDDRNVVVDTVDKSKTAEWLDNVAKALGGSKPDYLLIQHMEPDHGGSIQAFVEAYPDVTVIGN
ncbi:MAG: MBL fold metallo-hydrolase, partial [Bacteroidaceae bacterium]|nr:MBL fold metallo-hydrolase [Bacteroidaceae bacterium]